MPKQGLAVYPSVRVDTHNIASDDGRAWARVETAREIQDGSVQHRVLVSNPDGVVVIQGAAKLEDRRGLSTSKDLKSTRTPDVGKTVKGQGIYLGHQPVRDESNAPVRKDDGNFIRHHFFVATREFTTQNTVLKNGRRIAAMFDEAAKRVSSMLSPDIRKGEAYRSHQKFIEDLKSGNYSGEWRIPNSYTMLWMKEESDQNNFKGTFLSAPGAYYGTSSLDDHHHHIVMEFQSQALIVPQQSDNITELHWRPVRSIERLPPGWEYEDSVINLSRM